MSRLLAPLAVFGAVLVAMVALNGGAASPPALSAGGDLGRPSGDPVRDAQAAVRAAPASATAYAGLGDAYLSRARESGDPGFYSRAERAFDAALRRDPRDVAGLVGAGTLAGLRHDFAGAAAPRARGPPCRTRARAAPHRGGRRADRARALPAPRLAPSSGSST